MIRTFPSLCLLTSLALAQDVTSLALPSQRTTARAGEEQLVTRTYDVAGILVGDRTPYERFFRLASLLAAGHDYHELSSEGSEDVADAADDVVNLLVELLVDEFEYEGRSIQAVEYGRIVVRGPEGLHKRVADVLAFVDELVNAQADLVVSVLEVDPSVEQPFGGRVIVPRDEAERWLASGGSVTRQQELRMPLRSDRPSELDLTRTMPVLLDYDVEIAQAATIGDPIVSQVSIGTRAFVYAVPAPGGVALSLVLARSDLAGDVHERQIRVGGQVRTDSGIMQINPGSVFQTLDLATRSVALDAVLRHDQALVLYQRTELERARHNEVIVLRLTGGALPHRRPFAVGPQGQEGIAVDLRHAAPPSFQPIGLLASAGRMPFKLMEWLSGGGDPEQAILAVVFDHHETDYLLESLTSGETFATTRIGHYDLLRRYGATDDAQRAAAELGELRATLDSIERAPETISVELKLARSGRVSSVPVVTRLPVRLDHGCGVVLGIENPIAPDFDVEVAQDATVADAQVLSELEGLAVWLRATRTPRGDLALDVSAGGSYSARPRETLDLGMRDVERSVHDQVLVRQRIVFRQDAAEWRAVLGDASAGTTGEAALRLEISVAR